MNQSSLFSGQHLFAQLVSLCNRKTLSGVIRPSGANRYYKRLKVYEHFITMLYCAVSGADSLRSVVSGLELAQGKLRHLDLEYVPPRSTLSDGNKNRPSKVFEHIYRHLYEQLKSTLSDSTLPSKALVQRLFLLDSTTFPLFKAILSTGGRLPDNGKRKGGIKKNTLLDGATRMPSFVDFSAATANDMQVFKSLSLPPGSILVFDRGYNNHYQYHLFSEASIRFVTRMRDNAAYSSIAPDFIIFASKGVRRGWRA